MAIEEHVNAPLDDVRAVLEAAPVGMIKVDQLGTIVLTNRELNRMFGYSQEQLLGAPLEVLVPERYRDTHAQHVRSFSQAPITRAMGAGQELTGRRRDGTEFPIDVALNHVRFSGAHCVIASVIDVTEQRRSQAELVCLNAKLEEKNAELERFVFTVSHDLKAPIVTILGYLGHLRRDVDRSSYADVLDYSSRIQAVSERMRRKIDDLLRLSRIGREAASARNVGVQDIVGAVFRDHEGELHSRSVSIHTDFEAPTVWCDPQHLEQVVENLVANAIRHGTAEPHPTITVWSRRSGDSGVVLGVDDNGPGVEPRHAEKIFELFQRLGTDGDGTGIGLAIVQRVAQWYGGKAWVEANPGKGGRFRVYFPGPKADTFQRLASNDSPPAGECPFHHRTGDTAPP